MKRRGFTKCLSVILTLCMVLSCVAFSFSTVGAATVENGSTSVSANTAVEDTFSWDNATVYFLLTDRFKNGNTSNDNSYNRGKDKNGNVVSGIDTRATFHGGDFAGVTQAIEEGYFNDLGVNALWISAPYEQIHGYVVGDNGSPSYAHYSYHGYYVLDYTQTDANFGTAEEFETLVDTAHEHGLRVILDVVMNHAGYNSVYDMNEYGFGTVKSGWENSYYSHNNINNETYHSFIDYDSSASDWANWWGTDWIRCGVAGYSEEGGSDLTNTLSGLPDFRTESTKTVGIPAILKNKWTKEGRLSQETSELSAYLSKNGKSQTVTNTISYWLSTWVREFGVDGFRCDTAKHVEYASWKTLKDTCVDALKEWRTNNPNKPGADWDEDFWMTGEAWGHGVDKSPYFTQGGFDSMINFSTQGGGLVSQGSVKGTYNGFANAVNNDPEFNVLSYLSSHDSTLARGDMIKMGSAFLMLPGGVQIFYGDETNRPLVSGIGNDGNGGAGHSLRSDMNWDSMDKAVLAHWQKVGTFRNKHISVGAGSNTDLTTTSGYAFGRTYDKNGVSDKVAGVIYAGANTNVTVDVSALWSDGQNLMNAYDKSSAVVSGGKVTFNSGANGTILIQEPDGTPIMNVVGNSKFTGTQTVTVTLEECDYAKCSIDGGNKFYVYNGSTFTIGNTGYEGDTIEVTLEAVNEKGSSKATFSFVKASTTVDPTVPDVTVPVVTPKLYVKTWDGSAPYAYVWEGSDTALAGTWPGTKMSNKNSEGYYVLDLANANGTYGVVLNNGSGTQSKDITDLSGETYLEVTDSGYNVKTISTGNGGGNVTEPTEDSVTVRVKPYGNTAPYLYAWTGESNALCGEWPGIKLTEKDEDGNYVKVFENTSTINAIVNNGSGGQTGDITGISGDVIIEITNAECTAYKLTEKPVVLSGMPLLKKEAREVKAMTEADYMPNGWSALMYIMPMVDALVAQGDGADEAEVEAYISDIQSLKAQLKLAYPTLTYAVVGNSTIKGVAVPEADVTVTVNNKTYNVTADDVTGEFVVPATALTASSSIKVAVSRDDLNSGAYTYNMSSGNVEGGEVPTTPTEPVTQPVTQPTTQPVTQPTTQPTTQPSTDVVAETLEITANSNIFPSVTKTFDKEEGTVTVSYKLSANMQAVDSQWTLKYDSSKLEYTNANNFANGVQTIMPVVGTQLISNHKNGVLKGTFSSTGFVTFDKNAEFVTVTFNIIGTGKTEVYLDLEILSLAYRDSKNQIVDESIVDYSKMQDISGIKGFENASISVSTELSSDLLMGDVNGDGTVNVADATAIMKYVVNLASFGSLQVKAADVDGDGIVTVKDATLIQKFCVGMVSGF